MQYVQICNGMDMDTIMQDIAVRCDYYEKSNGCMKSTMEMHDNSLCLFFCFFFLFFEMLMMQVRRACYTECKTIQMRHACLIRCENDMKEDFDNWTYMLREAGLCSKQCNVPTSTSEVRKIARVKYNTQNSVTV